MNIQWYPGHMAKAKRQISDSLKLVDAVCELVDARIPESSRNPDLLDIIQNKPHIIALNKSDLADENATARWLDYYKSQNIPAIAINSNTGEGIQRFKSTVKDVLSEKIESFNEKGQINRSLRIMIIGIPNVGKSSFINRISQKKSAKVEDHPGVTRSQQWIKTNENIDVLDTPGVLWPKFEGSAGQMLAFTGAIKDEIIDLEALAYELCLILSQHYQDRLISRYRIDPSLFENQATAWEILENIGLKRGYLISKGEVDMDRTYKSLLNEYRAGKLGKITLEFPTENNE